MMGVYGYWISPSGEIHQILDDYGHKKFLKEQLGMDVDKSDDPESSLFYDGWIRIVNSTNTLMVNYKCITCKNQIKSIRTVAKDLESMGYNHSQYILDYGYNYHFFNGIEPLIQRIADRYYVDKL